MSDQEFARRFIERGARTASDLWRINNAWCKQLTRRGQLDHVRSLVNAHYVNERHEPSVDYFIARCRRYDFFEAWTCADRVAAQTARRLGFFDQVRALARHRPPRFSTRGGPVKSLAELVLARLLERNGVAFVTQPPYPFLTPGRRYHPMAADFALAGWWLEVWGLPADSTSRWAVSQCYIERRRIKTALCREHGLPLLSVEGSLLRRASLPIYVHHCALALQAAAIRLVRDVEPQELFALECLPDHSPNGATRGLEVVNG